MRNLTKLPIPAILAENHEEWLRLYLDDKSNSTNKYRYRHIDIKDTLKKETGWKCIYCESKIGHNTPGDVEHKIPSSKKEEFHFTWENLSVACNECNRRKNDYYEDKPRFLDPYIDDVESIVEHIGPILSWKSGNEQGEITVKTLELDTSKRSQLIFRKIEKIAGLNNLIERYSSAASDAKKRILKIEIKRMGNWDSEYSCMILSVLKIKGVKVT